MRTSVVTRLVVCLVVAACVAGCSVQPSANPVENPIQPAARASGRVFGGQQPVAGATIQLYTVGTAGDGSPATPLLTASVVTDANGNFNITNLYSCTNATEVYLTATGGNPGVTAANPNLTLMVALGPCSSLSASTYIVVNELTTVAAVSALAPYMSSVTAVGSSSGDAANLAAAFTLAAAYVNPATGLSPGVNVPTGDSAPSLQINTLGDIVAACVNSTGGTAGDGSACGNLFALTTPSNGTAPADTVGALLDLANNPGLNASGLFALSTAGAPFQPQLPSAPAGFQVSLSKTVASMMVTPAPATLAIGVTQQLKALATFTDGTNGDVTGAATWSSTVPATATVSSTGLVTPLAAGGTEVQATLGTASASASITVPNSTGGLVLNTNLTDPLLMSGTETDGTLDSFYGTRDSTGLPLSLYAVSSLGPDGTLRTAQMDSQGRLVHATSSAGVVYDIQWLTNTTGTIDFETTKGTPYAASAYFNLSGPELATRTPIVVPDNRAQPRDSSTAQTVTLTAQSACVNPVNEPGASMQVTLTDANGQVINSQPPVDNEDGTFTLQLPGNSAFANSVLSTAQQAASSLLQTHWCQETTSATHWWCPALHSALNSVLPPDSNLLSDCETTTTPAQSWCSTVNSASSYLNRQLNPPITITATASLDTHESYPTTEIGPPYNDLTVSLPCEEPTELDVYPTAVTTEVAQPQTVQAYLFAPDGSYVRSAAYSIAWASPSDPSAQYFVVGPQISRPFLPITITGVSPTPAALPVTATVQGPDASFLQPVTISVTVPQVSVAVSPTTDSVTIGGTAQFSATVTGAPNTAVNWSVNGIAGGNATVGTISASGLYTAPAAVPNPATVTIKATSQADSSASGSATVTITPCHTITYTNVYGQTGNFYVFIEQGTTVLYSASPSVSPSEGVFTVNTAQTTSPLQIGTTYTLLVDAYGSTGYGYSFSNYQVSLSADLQFTNGSQTMSGYFQGPSSLKLQFQEISACGQ